MVIFELAGAWGYDAIGNLGDWGKMGKKKEGILPWQCCQRGGGGLAVLVKWGIGDLVIG